MYEKAIAIDENYALAYAGIADSCSFLFMYAGSAGADRDQADQASRKALELDPELAEAHASRGLVLSLSEDYEGASENFERAVQLNPKLFEAYYFHARASASEGKLAKAAQLYEKAIEVRPEDYQARLLLPQIYRGLGRDEEAIKANQSGITAARKHLELNPGDVRALSLAASALVETGAREEGLEWAERAVTLAPNETMLMYNVACLYSLAGEPDRSFDFLERAIETGLAHRAWLESDNDLDSIRDDPRFQAILEKIG